MNNRTALIISPEWERYSFGDSHPFNIQRHTLALALMDAYGLTGQSSIQIHPPLFPSRNDLLSFHSPAYLDRLAEFSASDEARADFCFGLGDADNPVFKGMYEWACLGVGGTMAAAKLVTEGGYSAAFNLAGGWHHSHRAKASGFSYLNDAVIAINTLLEKGLRVAYLDIDAHHGDGVQEAYYDDNRVLTVSIHESGIYFFPGTGFEKEIGAGVGKGYSVNVPLTAHTDDALYMKAFDEVAYPLIAAFDPDVLVTQIGADTFRTDPLTRLEITTHSYSYILRKIKALRIPWVAVGGGGYDMVNVARAWSIALSIMCGVELSPKLPPAFVKHISALGYGNTMLLDAMHWAEDDDRNLALDAVEKSIAYLRKNVFPVIIGPYGTVTGE